MSPVISVKQLGKCYEIEHRSPRSSPMEWLRRTWHDGQVAAPPSREEFWALRDVSFEVAAGERLGIIGRNGAGKSTLLKILSRIVAPSKGEVRIRGRVASLLEVGTGFHPELTGRENIFLNGAVLGMSRDEIRRKFDAIIDFAEVEKFLDTQVKHYSSGMYVRLAFAVAAHLETEILIADEVLAVGDSRFQRKCLEKMGEVGKYGRTLLFVSHNMQSISTLTPKCLVLEKGNCTFNGDSAGAIQIYHGMDFQPGSAYVGSISETTPQVASVSVLTSEPNGYHNQGKALTVELVVTTPYSLDGAALAFHICDAYDQPILHFLHLDKEQPFCRKPGFYKLKCVIPELRLYLGRYSLKVHFAESSTQRKFQTLEAICPFEVLALERTRDYYWYPNNAKYIEDHHWQIES